MSAVASAEAEVVTVKCEPSVKDAMPDLPAEALAKAGLRYQFERLAYCRTRQRHLVRLGFALDSDSKPGKLVFNRTITLKDTRAKELRKG